MTGYFAFSDLQVEPEYLFWVFITYATPPMGSILLSSLLQAKQPRKERFPHLSMPALYRHVTHVNAPSLHNHQHGCILIFSGCIYCRIIYYIVYLFHLFSICAIHLPLDSLFIYRFRSWSDLFISIPLTMHRWVF